MSYKIIRDEGHGKEVLYASDSLEEIARFCEQKSGSGGGFDLGVEMGDDGGLL